MLDHTGRETAVLQQVELLIRAYHAGLLGGTQHEVFPEIDRNTLAWRTYFTLPCAINYQRNSESLWRSALRTFEDPETQFVFDCRNAVRGFSGYKDALSKHKLALQPDKHSKIWFTISETLCNHFEGDPLKLLESSDLDVGRIKKYITSNKTAYPYLSGPKLLNYWLYIFSSFTDVPLKSREEISVVPDTHVKRATAKLGLMSIESVENTEAVAAFWAEFLSGTKYAPSDLHAPLWRWSRASFPDIDYLEAQLG